MLERSKREEISKFLYSNFKSMRTMGRFAFKKDFNIRPRLGDYTHVSLFCLRYLSMAYLYPIVIYDFYNIGKVLGYFGVYSLPSEKMQLLRSIRKKLMDVFGGVVYKNIRYGWSEIGGGIVELVEINKDKNFIKYRLYESPVLPSENRINHPGCFMQLGGLCGIIEGLSGKFCDGIEKKCILMGDKYCEFHLYIREEEKMPKFEQLSREEFKLGLDAFIDYIVNGRYRLRKMSRDYIHISINQALNYILLSISKGHVVLSKFSGRRIGEEIAEKTKIRNLFDMLDYLRDVFSFLKIGIVETEMLPDKIIVRVEESAYSYGVKDIGMKLCIFIAGIIEGSLEKSTGAKWNVEEGKCIANGDKHCEFECKTENPKDLEKMLLGY